MTSIAWYVTINANIIYSTETRNSLKDDFLLPQLLVASFVI